MNQSLLKRYIGLANFLIIENRVFKKKKSHSLPSFFFPPAFVSGLFYSKYLPIALQFIPATSVATFKYLISSLQKDHKAADITLTSLLIDEISLHGEMNPTTRFHCCLRSLHPVLNHFKQSVKCEHGRYNLGNTPSCSQTQFTALNQCFPESF